MATATMSFTVDKRFVLAGHAIFTAHSRTGTHFTFRVSKAQKPGQPPVWFVAVLTGPDNESDYEYLGMLDAETGEIRITAKSRFTYGEQIPSVKAARWTLRRIWSGREWPEGCGVSGEGRCGRCGRTLTAPDGVSEEGFRFGYGPICWEKMQAEGTASRAG